MKQTSLEKQLTTVLKSRFDGASSKKKAKPTQSYVAPKIPNWRDSKRVVTRPNTNVCETSKSSTQRYTGTLIKGIGLLHKSCLQPIISDQEAVDIARMRR